MKNNEYRSLEEVYEMKEAVWEDFQKSDFKGYAEYIENEMIKLRKEFSFLPFFENSHQQTSKAQIL